MHEAVKRGIALRVAVIESRRCLGGPRFNEREGRSSRVSEGTITVEAPQSRRHGIS